VEPAGIEAKEGVTAVRPLRAAGPCPLVFGFGFGSRPGRLVVVAALTVLSMSGVAGAYWSMSGSGSGSVTVASLSLRVEEATAGESDPWLFPGSVGDLEVRVSNQGDAPIRIHDLEVGAPIVEPAECPASAVRTFSGRADHPALGAFLDGLDPLSAGETRDIRVPEVVAMALSAPDVCQGAVFVFPVTVEGRS
jgi:hypothetical protein